MKLLLLKWNREKIIDSLFQILMGMLGAAILLFVFHLMNPPKQIATVNVTKMIDEFVKTQSSSQLSPEALQDNVTRFGVSMDKALRDIAREKQLVLLPKEAVIAGSIDVSDEVAERVNTAMNYVAKDKR